MKYRGLEFELPDSFRWMTEEELKDNFTNDLPGREAAFDPDMAMNISFYSRKVNLLFAKINNKKKTRNKVMKDFIKSNPQVFGVIPYDDYIADKERYGYRYQYKKDGVLMHGDMLFILNQDDYYTLCAASAHDCWKESQIIVEKMLESIRFTER